MDTDFMVRAAIVLFVIMDPFASLPAFLALTRRIPNKDKYASATKASVVAGMTLILFTLAGPPFLSLIGVTMQSFMVAGGLMLLLIAILMVLGVNYGQNDEKKLDVAAVLIAVPLITGPGAMTAAIILAAAYGLENVIGAIVVATVAMWVVLKASQTIYAKLGPSGTEVSSRISGLLLAAIAVEFIRNAFGS